MTNNTPPSLIAVQRAMASHQDAKAAQMLIGIVSGIVADGQLHDLEVRLLQTWISANERVCSTWPGAAVASWLHEILSDGVITSEERALLLGNLKALAGSDFAETGSATPEPTQLPIDDSQPVALQGVSVVFTGTFLFGTRSRCERVAEAAGSRPVGSVTKKTDLVVIGTQITPTWLTDAYGRKIVDAMRLQGDGHPIRIISERHWLAQLGALGTEGSATA